MAVTGVKLTIETDTEVTHLLYLSFKDVVAFASCLNIVRDLAHCDGFGAVGDSGVLIALQRHTQALEHLIPEEHLDALTQRLCDFVKDRGFVE